MANEPLGPWGSHWVGTHQSYDAGGGGSPSGLGMTQYNYTQDPSTPEALLSNYSILKGGGMTGQQNAYAGAIPDYVRDVLSGVTLQTRPGWRLGYVQGPDGAMTFSQAAADADTQALSQASAAIKANPTYQQYAANPITTDQWAQQLADYAKTTGTRPGYGSSATSPASPESTAASPPPTDVPRGPITPVAPRGPGTGPGVPGPNEFPGLATGASPFGTQPFPLWVYSGGNTGGPVMSPLGGASTAGWNRQVGFGGSPGGSDSNVPPVNGACQPGYTLSADGKTCVKNQTGSGPPGGGPPGGPPSPTHQVQREATSATATPGTGGSSIAPNFYSIVDEVVNRNANPGFFTGNG